MKVEERAQEILGELSRLRGDFAKIQENFRILGTASRERERKLLRNREDDHQARREADADRGNRRNLNFRRHRRFLDRIDPPRRAVDYSTSSHLLLSLSMISRSKRIGGMPWLSSSL